ncbi:MAG TPA: type IV secretory system conjugative DNA transfer family protein [Fimbriimonadaceae bacterium]|nr:type IV secretory system conjugative DNA transfer family protein [Fimbriimonadaceae bacterium]
MEKTPAMASRPATSPSSSRSLANMDELQSAGILARPDSIWPTVTLLSEEGIFDVDGVTFPDNIYERHILVIGQTGSGKTTTVGLALICQALKEKRRIVIVKDPKGDLIGPVTHLTRLLRGKGAKVVQLAFHRPDRSVGFNPFRAPLGKKHAKKIAVYLSSLNPIGNESSFWKNTREQVLTEVIEKLSMLPGMTIGEVANLLTMPVDRAIPVLKDAGCEQTLELWQSASGGSNNAMTVVQDVSSTMTCFLEEDVLAVTSSDEFGFEDLTEPTVVILGFPEGQDRLRPVQGMFVNALFDWIVEKSATSSGSRLPTPITCFFDEFASLGRLPSFERVLNTFRSRDVRFVVLTQTLSQLAEVYRESQGSVLAGFGSLIAVPPVSFADAQYLSEYGGEMIALQYESRGGLLTGQSSFARPVLTPDEIRSNMLKPRQRPALTFFLSGMPAFQAHLPAIYEFPEFGGWDRRNGGKLPDALPPPRKQPLTAPTEFRTSSKASLKGATPAGARQASADLRKEVGYDSASILAKAWWVSFEAANASKSALIEKLVEELKARKATIQDLYDAHQQSGIDNIQGNLDFMAYLAARKREKPGAPPFEGIPESKKKPGNPNQDDE